MKADDLRLLFKQHRHMLGADIACHPLRLRYRPQPLGVVVRLQIMAHRLAGFRRVARLWPQRIVDVETTWAQLAKASNTARSFFCCQPPHADATEATGIADCGS